MYGRDISVDESIEELCKDREFYDQSGGGITLSGGEPLLQLEFVVELLSRCAGEDLHRALDTCGNVPWGHFEAVLPYVDLILFDLKLVGSENHEQYTGVGNELIIENLQKLAEQRVDMEIRVPVIPGINDGENIDATAALVASLPRAIPVRLLRYHRLAGGKYKRLGLPDTMPQVDAPSGEHMQELAGRLEAAGVTVLL